MEQAKSLSSAKRQTGITILLALSMLLASLGTSITNIALPTLAEAFSAPFVQVQAVVVAYLGTLTISVVIAGRLGDSYGLKLMLMAGLAMFAIASLLCGIAPTLSLLIGARAFQGIGAAFVMTLAMALMRQAVSKDHIGQAMGLLGTASALGTALGPPLGGLLIAVVGWRYIFWLQLLLAGIALILALMILPGDSGKSTVRSSSLWSVMGRSLLPNLLVNLLVATIMMTTLLVGPFYLGLGLCLQATQVGFAMAVGPVIAIFSGVPSGRLVDAWGSGSVLIMGLTLLAIGVFLLAFLPNMIGITGYVLSIIVLTPGYQFFQSANNTAALVDIPKDLQGTVSGLLSLSRNIGLIIGASAMGVVFSLGVGTEEFAQASAADIAAGMRLTFLVAGGVMISALMIICTSRRA